MELDLDDLDKLKDQADKSDDSASSHSEDDLADDPRAKRRENAFYQNPNDQLHFRDEDAEEASSLVDQYRDRMRTSNPAGENFMKWLPEGIRLPTYSTITSQLAQLKRRKALPDQVASVSLNSKQALFYSLVNDYVQQWHTAKKDPTKQYPKALRLFLLGDPGTGKSTTTRTTMMDVRKQLGALCENVVREATPTGCASFQLSAGATTVHSLFGLSITAKRIIEDPKKVKMLEDKFKDGLCLLLIDEVSMESRSMVGIIVERLRDAHVDLDKMGVIFCGDPAQLLPIGGEPCWSLKLTQGKANKSYDNESIFGLADFRTLFRMCKLEDVPNYSAWKSIETLNAPTEAQRKVIAEFTLQAYLLGDYDAVYLTDILRSVAGDADSERMVKHLIPNARYGKSTEADLLELMGLYATKQEVAVDYLFCQAKNYVEWHYYTQDDPARKTVEAENIRRIFDYSKMYDKPVVHLESLHMPTESASNLAQLSGKDFEGLLKNFLACCDIPLMLLTNMAPQFGLFNGAITNFVGLLYLKDDADVFINSTKLKDEMFKGTTLDMPMDLASTYNSQYHQLPKGSTLLAVDDKPMENFEDVKAAISCNKMVKCTFSLPKSPPAMPNFIVVQSDAYKTRGGPNILEFAGAENMIPIPLTKASRKQSVVKGKSKAVFEHRVGFKVECAIVVTPYKAQGATEKRVIAEVKSQASVPGLWLVVNSRVISPKHIHIPEGNWPSAMDINLQRLNSFVLEAETFERAMKIQAAKTLRLCSIECDTYGEPWSYDQSDLATMIGGVYLTTSHRSPKDVWDYLHDEIELPMPVDERFFASVLEKLELTDERLLKETAPFLTQAEYQKLTQYQKSKRTGTKTKKKK